MLRPRWIATVSIAGVIFFSLAAGFAIDHHRARARDLRLVGEVEQTIDHVIIVARSRHARLAELAGQSCPSIQSGLSALDYITPYLRQVRFAHDGVLYCSTVAGIDSRSMTAPLLATGASQQIAFSDKSLLTPGMPLLLVYNRVRGYDGILYVIEGAYIVDLLSRATASGAESVVISARSGGSLTSDGRLIDTPPWPPAVAQAAGDSFFSVRIEPDPIVRRNEFVTTELLTLVLGLALFGILYIGYSAGFTPRQRLQRQVLAGLRRGEFFVVYQTFVDLRTGRWSGAEALLRWNHPRFGLVMPGRFIGEIEETSVIAPLTRFVMETALTDFSSVPFPDGFRLSINVAPRHIEMPSFLDDMRDALRNRAAHLRVVLEITERGLLSSGGSVHESIATLRRAGVEFAIDDFGIENSNLSMLRQFAFDYIKIDKQFVDHVTGHGAELVEGILLLADKLKAAVVAEGVEDAAQHVALRAFGVSFAQGYLYQRPMKFEAYKRAYRESTEIVDSMHRTPSFC